MSFVFAFFLVGILIIPQSFAQDPDAISDAGQRAKALTEDVIPSWIKNNAGWWANDEITENEFLRAIEYLIKKDIIVISDISSYEKSGTSIDFSYTKLVPNWIKNNAGWWADGQIDDSSFVSGIQWLISNGIIQVEIKKILNQTINGVVLASGLNVENSELVFYYSDFFNVYCFKNDIISYTLQQGKLVPNCLSSAIALNPNNMDIYEQIAIWDEPQKVAVVYPVFTASAYQGSDPIIPAEERGFYAYYQGLCDDCTTVKIIPENNSQKLAYTASGMGIQVLSLLGYTTLSDIDIDQNPDMLKEFDAVVMLHNEYVTRTMFNAVTDHPNVLYLYPNALYAEIEVNYIDGTITLIRGHNYPEPEIINGFDWEFDNTHPYEYDNTCENMEFYKIENGWMTNCYPDVLMKENRILLGEIKNRVHDNDFEKTNNVEKHILDWDTVVNDSKYAYDGSIKRTADWFGIDEKDYESITYIIKFNSADNFVYDFSQPTLLDSGVWLYQITGDEKFLQKARDVANVTEEYYLHDSGIVMNVHPLTRTVKNTEVHTNQEILLQGTWGDNIYRRDQDWKIQPWWEHHRIVLSFRVHRRLEI